MTSVKCKNCGADVPANMKFCGTCGTPAEHPEVSGNGEPTVATPVPGKAMAVTGKLMKYIKPAIVLVAVIIIASIAFNIFKPAKYTQPSSRLFISQDDDSVVIALDGKTKSTIKGRLGNQSYSFDGKTAAILVNDSDESTYGSDSEGYSLYIVTDKATFVTDGVHDDIKLSLSGDGIAFTREIDNDTRTAELCLWSVGKVSTVTTDYSTRNGFSISPDGKTVAYTLYDEDEDKVEGCYYNGKETSLGKDIIPVAIANGAKYVYYNKKDSLYVQAGANGDSKNKLGEGVYDYYFNNDLTQIIYNSSSKAYISRNGGEKESLSDTISYFILPAGTVSEYNNGQVIGISSFADTFYINGSSVIHINGKFETNNAVKNANNPQLAKDGKTIIYRRNDSIYKINGTKENAEDKELVKEDVHNFIATSDGGAVYFCNTDDELFYQKGTGKPVRIGEDLGGNYFYGDYWAMFGGNKLFFISDDELFWSTGGKGKAVTDIDGDIDYMFANNKFVYVQATDGSDTFTYISKDGEKFELYSTN